MHSKNAHPAHANGLSVPIRWIDWETKKDSPLYVTVLVISLKWNLVLLWFKAIMHHPPHSFATNLLPTLFLS